MSDEVKIEALKREIDRFLRSRDAEVLAIRGKWGVGKTYLWNERLMYAFERKQAALNDYSYVSLFGLDSLSKLQVATFENKVNMSSEEPQRSIDQLDAFFSKHVSWRKKVRWLSFIPPFAGLSDIEATAALALMDIKEQIVCIDDIERRGSNLRIKDVLGYMSFLRENKNCKVVLILNNESFDEEEKAELNTHFEKVVDIKLLLSPSSSEATRIGLSSHHEHLEYVRSRCHALGITNIRVIRHIAGTVARITPLFSGLEEEVTHAAISSTILFCWSFDKPDEAPPVALLRELTSEWALFAPDDEVKAKDEKGPWKALLEAYGYTWTDDLDLALLEGVDAGYFDESRVIEGAKKLNERILASKADGSFEAAWRLYHDTFDDNQEVVLQEIYSSFKRNYHYISPVNLDGTVRLFKELGHRDQALKMIEHYVHNRDEDAEFFDLHSHGLGFEVNDPDVIEAFDKKFMEFSQSVDFATALLSIKEGWNDKQLRVLAEAGPDPYYEVFKSCRGQDLRQALASALYFNRVANATEDMKKITQNAKDALLKIGKESDINARRVRRFGVLVNDNST